MSAAVSNLGGSHRQGMYSKTANASQADSRERLSAWPLLVSR